jgi:hypothetical protein
MYQAPPCSRASSSERWPESHHHHHPEPPRAPRVMHPRPAGNSRMGATGRVCVCIVVSSCEARLSLVPWVLVSRAQPAVMRGGRDVSSPYRGDCESASALAAGPKKRGCVGKHQSAWRFFAVDSGSEVIVAGQPSTPRASSAFSSDSSEAGVCRAGPTKSRPRG